MTTGTDKTKAGTLSRLQRRRQQDDLELSQSLRGLAGILDDGKQHPGSTEKTGDLLQDACQQVLNAAGIKIALKKTAAADPEDKLARFARQANASLRRVVLGEETWWREDAGPLLAFEKAGERPVALIPAGERGYVFEDPVSGKFISLTAENSKALADTAFMFFRKFPQHKLDLRDLLRFGALGTRRDLLFSILCGALGGLLGIASPYATGLLIDTIIPGAHRDELMQLVFLLISSALAMSAFQLARSLAMLRIHGRMGNASQAAIIDRIIHLPTSFFRDYAVGDLAQRAFSIDTILSLLTGTTQTAVLSWVFGLFSFVYLVMLNGPLALLAGVLVGITLLVTLGLNLWRLRLERRMFTIQGKISSRVLQLLNGISKLRSSGAEKRGFALWAKDFREQKKLDFSIRSIANMLLVFDAGYIVFASLVLFAAVAYFEADLSAGTFIAFNAAFTQFLAATLTLSTALTDSLNIIPLYERARPILETLPEHTAVQSDPGELLGNIDISHVSFRYSEDGPLVLNNISLSIKAGEFIAIVGASGSGKSTLMRLLLGFEVAESGAVYYDQHDLAGLDLVTVRRQLGVVLQNGKLMPGDIFTNIVGSSSLTLEDAWEAARMAGFEEDIKAMPMGMHTLIAEGAGTISGGQKQRLMIARAIVKKPKILLFDEATSALDNRTQAMVASSIERLNSTRIVIAHRLSTVMKADRIFVIEAGVLVESGNYQELMAHNGYFATLATRQLA